METATETATTRTTTATAPTVAGIAHRECTRSRKSHTVDERTSTRYHTRTAPTRRSPRQPEAATRKRQVTRQTLLVAITAPSSGHRGPRLQTIAALASTSNNLTRHKPSRSACHRTGSTSCHPSLPDPSHSSMHLAFPRKSCRC
jgi:hypothetical protein